MENLGRLNRAVNKKDLDKEKVREIIEDIDDAFVMLQTEFDLSMSMPLKIHIIISHYLEFFNEKNESMLSYNDEFTESMHSAIRLFEQHHKYFNSKKGTKGHKKMQQKSTVHINRLNLGDI